MLEELLHSKKMVKTIEHFILHEEWEQNQKDLCEILDIYPKAMRNILSNLKEFDIIVETRQISKSKFYKLNKNSELIKPLRILSQKFGTFRAIQKAESQIKKEEKLGKVNEIKKEEIVKNGSK